MKKIIRLTESELIKIVKYIIKEESEILSADEMVKNVLPLKIAKNQIGKPYKWGDEGPDRFDCSGLVSYSFKVPRTTAVGYFNSSLFKKIDKKNLIPGDLIFFGSLSKPHHVGIIDTVGSGGVVTKMVHASGGQKCPGKPTNNGRNCIVKLSPPSTKVPIAGYRRFKHSK